MATGPLHPTGFGGAIDRGDPLQCAMVALNSQRPQEAERIARDVLNTDPRHNRALHVLGCALLMQGRAEDAITPLESAARGRHDPEIETQLAMAKIESGHPDDALVLLKRAVKRRPAYAQAFHALGRLLFTEARYEEAAEALSRGLEIAPMMPDLSILLGIVHLKRRDYANAKLAFSRGLDISPDSADALHGMATAQWELREYRPAADHFRRYLQRRPADAGTWLSLGHCLLELGEREAGYDCFRTAARGNPKRYGTALASLANSGHARFWLKPSAAEQFLRGTKS
jgi:tetratricopeptide (TPR) repeat protein